MLADAGDLLCLEAAGCWETSGCHRCASLLEHVLELLDHLTLRLTCASRPASSSAVRAPVRSGRTGTSLMHSTNCIHLL